MVVDFVLALLRRIAVVVVGCCAMWLALPPSDALAVQPDEVLSDAQLEGRARELSATLRCLVCQNQSIDDSDAPLARDLRLLVRERLVAGDSDDEVISFLVARYGEFVLLKPTWGLHTMMLWLTPLLVLGGAVFLARRVFSAGGTGAAGAGAAEDFAAQTPRLSKKEEARLKRILDGESTDGDS